MQNDGPLLQKSFQFAVQIVHFCRSLARSREFVLSKQLLRSGTSIGANIEEESQAESKKDFISKLSIALKEAHESRFWLRLIRETKIRSPAETDVLLAPLQEITKMLAASIRTAKFFTVH
jgi:four helix bundle protein